MFDLILMNTLKFFKKDKQLISKNVTYTLVLLSLFITLVIVVAALTQRKKPYHAPVSILSFLKWE